MPLKNLKIHKMRCHCTLTSMAKTTDQVLMRIWSNWNSCALLVGMQIKFMEKKRDGVWRTDGTELDNRHWATLGF